MAFHQNPGPAHNKYIPYIVNHCEVGWLNQIGQYTVAQCLQCITDFISVISIDFIRNMKSVIHCKHYATAY